MDSRDQQNQRSNRHPSKKFDLMVQQATVIQNPHERHQRGSRQNANNLRAGLAIHRSEEHTSELQSQSNLVCRLLLEKKKKKKQQKCNTKRETLTSRSEK